MQESYDVLYDENTCYIASFSYQLHCWHEFTVSFFVFCFFINLFIFGSAGSSFWCAVSHCGGFSCCGAQALGTWASVVVARGLSSCGSRALECRLSSCDTRA